mmetsp:Transcript_1505/g.2707  ORF Transcript_1505/g.2707 Transcript_1505/m.2707 type:complete len:275 (-) Transcript_1505:463-1287(-)
MSEMNVGVEIVRLVKTRIEKSTEFKDESARNAALNSPLLNESTALRYYKGYHKVNKAVNQLENSILYRVNTDTNYSLHSNADSILNQNALKISKNLTYIGGFDFDEKDSVKRPVIIIRKREGEAIQLDQASEYLKYLMFVLDCAAFVADLNCGSEMKEENGKWVFIMDMKGSNRSNMPPKSVAKDTLSIFSNHFPERLHKCFILDASTGFYAFWTIISPFIDSVTRNKIVFIWRSQPDQVQSTVSIHIQKLIDQSIHEGQNEFHSIITSLCIKD